MPDTSQLTGFSTQDHHNAAKAVADTAYQLAEDRDADGAIPDTEITALAIQGLLNAPLPPGLGGSSLGMTSDTAPLLRDVLRRIGGASLSLGRLYEGHVNAIRLVTQYGTVAQLALLAKEANCGRLSAVWNAQSGDGLRFNGRSLRGGKIYCSGIGLVHRPILTATGPDGLVMLMPDISAVAGDLSAWTPLGMKATLTGFADFTGVEVSEIDRVGVPGDYYRSPLFSGGAWRVLAVQLGALERLVALYRTQMSNRGRSDDPIQRRRFGKTAASLETCRLWSARAANIAEDVEQDPAEIDAVVNFARAAFERAALDIIERVERGVGLSAMLRPDPIERTVRDLTTYLRQPFPDAALDSAALWALRDRPMHRDMGEI